MFSFTRGLLSSAGTDTPAPGLGESLMGLILPIGIFGIIAYFLLYRPQKKQERTVNEMRNSIKVGDEISTNGGIFGRVVQIKDDFLIIETSGERTKLKIAKWAVRAVEGNPGAADEPLKPSADDSNKSTKYRIKKK